MAYVHLISAKANQFVAQPPPGGVGSGVSDVLLIGNPSAVTKLAAVPGAFAAAGSPDASVSSDDKLLIINTDTAIDVAIVRKGHLPASVVPVPIAVANGGVTSYTVLLPPYATDIFVRALA